MQHHRLNNNAINGFQVITVHCQVSLMSQALVQQDTIAPRELPPQHLQMIQLEMYAPKGIIAHKGLPCPSLVLVVSTAIPQEISRLKIVSFVLQDIIVMEQDFHLLLVSVLLDSTAMEEAFLQDLY
ncbi:hypothetical protein JD844_031441 [Phrynosoma platyrhinos]|uniref:Uncharacterized protein n=1 Tax=Phrynosoma platyrhinos TaxID=52577 RepID=A0ABQ7T113_PHRPL|nr:hypothetical protein JD844_031441 [Phrynosoma platyrhinos]